jgi:hypothetical protein
VYRSSKLEDMVRRVDGTSHDGTAPFGRLVVEKPRHLSSQRFNLAAELHAVPPRPVEQIFLTVFDINAMEEGLLPTVRSLGNGGEPSGSQIAVQDVQDFVYNIWVGKAHIVMPAVISMQPVCPETLINRECFGIINCGTT